MKCVINEYVIRRAADKLRTVCRDWGKGMAGRLVVIEGTDGSGKSTQFKLLTKRLEEDGEDFRHVVFPQYTQPSSALVRMYLGGEFGSKPGDVNPLCRIHFFLP